MTGEIALIGDVHGNLPALEAVLADAHGRGVGAIWNVGDFVGYGPFPDEVVQRLREENAVSIAGNYDLKMLKVKANREKWRTRKHPHKLLAFEWAYDHLSVESRAYLRSLPEEIRLKAGDRGFLLTHGSPASNTEYVNADTSAERLQELAKMAGADAVVCGHSHQALLRQVDGVWFINTGSVGRPDDGDPRACYAVLRIGPEAIDVCHHRLAYDVERAVAALREHALPEAFAQMLLQGRKLEAILDSMDEEEKLEAVLALARSCDYEAKHTHQVTRLACLLFDELQPLHGFGPEERFWLRCGALLHDVGWIEGQRRHHKTSLRIVLSSPELLFNDRERQIIGLIARYHRRALPKAKHRYFRALPPADQWIVRVLAGILRVADGLDRTHWSVVEDLSCAVSEQEILVRCAVRRPAEAEREVALRKGELMEDVFDRRLAIAWRLA